MLAGPIIEGLENFLTSAAFLLLVYLFRSRFCPFTTKRSNQSRSVQFVYIILSGMSHGDMGASQAENIVLILTSVAEFSL